jgi:hypothetical protein
MGRPLGYRPINTKLAFKEPEIERMMRLKWKKTKISKRLKVSVWTLRRKLIEMDLARSVGYAK